MRPIHVARLDKSRPVLVLTREVVRPHMNTVTVAPITTTIRGLSTEVTLGPANGLEERCVVACDHVTTIPAPALGTQIGQLLDDQEVKLTDAIHAAFDLDR
ncbi:MAG TPA: type II toxin-antitoxin system PemK/MazF family toxin [Gaiellaceae bacterium]|jgi:mRNA interferase MazF|nr:type II toxin-antitoxin system PemK/MazF family toxin [Gaiellaceae bacterium]